MNIPKIALGTGGIMKQNNDLFDMIAAAKQGGIKHIDTAHKYANEEAVGDAIYHLDWDDVFVTSKVNPVNMKYYVKDSVMQSLYFLGINKINMILLHGPVNREVNASAYKELIKLRKLGVVEHIGVSNFSIDQLKELKEDVGEWPVNDQVFISPTHPNVELVEFCKANGIIPSAYSSLGCLFRKDSEFYLEDQSVINDLASKYNKTTSQVLLRWLLDRNINVVFQSRNPERILVNSDILDFKLTKAEVEAITSLDLNKVFDDGMAIDEELLEVGEIY